MNKERMNNGKKPQNIVPSPLPELSPKLARRCQSCGAPFETRCYSFEHCERCNVARMLAVSAYCQHESAWEERQRAQDAEALHRLAAEAARNAGKRLTAWRLLLLVSAGSVVFGLLKAWGY